jgi:hypothetical protein
MSLISQLFLSLATAAILSAICMWFIDPAWHITEGFVGWYIVVVIAIATIRAAIYLENGSNGNL